jgi:hypothetical protein
MGYGKMANGMGVDGSWIMADGHWYSLRDLSLRAFRKINTLPPAIPRLIIHDF